MQRNNAICVMVPAIFAVAGGALSAERQVYIVDSTTSSESGLFNRKIVRLKFDVVRGRSSNRYDFRPDAAYEKLIYGGGQQQTYVKFSDKTRFALSRDNVTRELHGGAVAPGFARLANEGLSPRRDGAGYILPIPALPDYRLDAPPLVKVERKNDINGTVRISYSSSFSIRRSNGELLLFDIRGDSLSPQDFRQSWNIRYGTTIQSACGETRAETNISNLRERPGNNLSARNLDNQSKKYSLESVNNCSVEDQASIAALGEAFNTAAALYAFSVGENDTNFVPLAVAAASFAEFASVALLWDSTVSSIVHNYGRVIDDQRLIDYRGITSRASTLIASMFDADAKDMTQVIGNGSTELLSFFGTDARNAKLGGDIAGFLATVGWDAVSGGLAKGTIQDLVGGTLAQKQGFELFADMMGKAEIAAEYGEGVPPNSDLGPVALNDRLNSLDTIRNQLIAKFNYLSGGLAESSSGPASALGGAHQTVFYDRPVSVVRVCSGGISINGACPPKPSIPNSPQLVDVFQYITDPSLLPISGQADATVVGVPLFRSYDSVGGGFNTFSSSVRLVGAGIDISRNFSRVGESSDSASYTAALPVPNGIYTVFSNTYGPNSGTNFPIYGVYILNEADGNGDVFIKTATSIDRICLSDCMLGKLRVLSSSVGAGPVTPGLARRSR